MSANSPAVGDDGLPRVGFLRLRQIVGDPKACPPIPAIIPVSRAAWWLGVKTGKYPQPVKLGPNTTCWRVADIRQLIERLGNPAAGEQAA